MAKLKGGDVWGKTWTEPMRLVSCLMDAENRQEGGGVALTEGDVGVDAKVPGSVSSARRPLRLQESLVGNIRSIT
jgi:hypothetical protein